MIRLPKKALSQYGYRFMAEIDADKSKEEWKDDNAVFYYNKSQNFKAEIYAKLADMKIHNYDTEGYAGLLRFELALSYVFMKRKKYINEKYLEADNPA